MRKREEEIIKVYKVPKLTNPSLVAAWPGIANVALTAASYISDSLKAKEFAEVQSLSFFDLNGALIEKNLVQAPRFPESKFYYWKRNKAGGDLIFFIGEAQPAARSYEFANKILDFVQGFGVTRVYTLAAAIVPQFADKPRVWAAATDNELLSDLESNGLVLKGNFYVAGMNGLLLSVAKEKNMRGICLLGETPRYLSDIGNPIASQSVIEVLTRLLNIEIDMTELEQMVKEARQQIDEAIRESRRQYIDQFTVPLWERPPEEEKG